MSNKTLKKYFITDAKRGRITGVEKSRDDAREFRIPFREKIVQVEYNVKPNGTIEIINQKPVR